jgi:hypothetical protein
MDRGDFFFPKEMAQIMGAEKERWVTAMSDGKKDI